jgi:hypothetical protein
MRKTGKTEREPISSGGLHGPANEQLHRMAIQFISEEGVVLRTGDGLSLHFIYCCLSPQGKEEHL